MRKEARPFGPPLDALEPRLVEEHGTRGHRLPGQELVDLWPVPVSVGHAVVRARGHEELPRVLGPVGEGPVPLVAEEAEPALQPAGQLRIRPLPGPPFGERADARQVVTIGQLLDQQVRQRRRRLADREAGMAAPFEQDHGAPLPA